MHNVLIDSVINRLSQILKDTELSSHSAPETAWELAHKYVERAKEIRWQV